MTASFGDDNHSIGFELTKLRSELRLEKLDLQNRILDLVVRLAWRRLHVTWGICAVLQITILGALIMLS